MVYFLMIDTLRIYEELKNEISPSAAKKIADAIGRVYTEVLNTVTKEEFKELREIVSELAEARRLKKDSMNLQRPRERLKRNSENSLESIARPGSTLVV